MSITENTLVVPEVHRKRFYVVAQALYDGLDAHGQLFRLVRDEDRSGVSGTGIVAKGVELPGGLSLMWWVVEGKPSTCTPYGAVTEVAHIHGHHGDSRVQRLTKHGWQET